MNYLNGRKTKQGKAVMKAGRNKEKTHGGDGNNANVNNITRKQLQAKIASMEQSSKASEGGSDDNDNAEISNTSGITLDQVKAMIAIANAATSSNNKKREKADEDPHVAATLAIQQILKRSRN